jgi:hypothetical protein
LFAVGFLGLLDRIGNVRLLGDVAEHCVSHMSACCVPAAALMTATFPPSLHACIPTVHNRR